MGKSDFLFAWPTVATGIARNLDLFYVLQEYNRSVTSEQADAWALYNDFLAVGNDLRAAMREVEKSQAR